MSGLVSRNSVDVVQEGYVVARFGGHSFGIPTLDIQDVVRLHAVTPVPTAPSYVRGIANMRGRVATVIDPASYLGLPQGDPDHCVTVVWKGALCGFLVEEVDRVINIAPRAIERLPFTVPQTLKAVSKGVFEEKDNLIILLDLGKLLVNIDGTGEELEPLLIEG
ncbi:chemotaxis protein CheW [Aestuariispira insulae]|uniref:Purine-binding chemotaxis protein CheW n=1 Tax=Aestuariispira insulae TaxID=1461337 RepID=A0A3D9HJU0_9PROT|nr:chemotaxis protein CheW [Aestuariispira insulae]RED49738.1 purine-binding chemotaxis protein CheW [Aestuariispira insulae]